MTMLGIGNFRLGQKVIFGRRNGEKTFGVVIKLNPTKAKVKTLENRGSRHPAGVEWNVPYSMMTAAGDDGKPAELPPLVHDQLPAEDNAILEAISMLYAKLSPENLSLDGELPAARVWQLRVEYNKKLRALQVALGREVTDAQVTAWYKTREAVVH